MSRSFPQQAWSNSFQQKIGRPDMSFWCPFYRASSSGSLVWDVNMPNRLQHTAHMCWFQSNVINIFPKAMQEFKYLPLERGWGLELPKCSTEIGIQIKIWPWMTSEKFGTCLVQKQTLPVFTSESKSARFQLCILALRLQRFCTVRDSYTEKTRKRVAQQSNIPVQYVHLRFWCFG